MKGEVSTKFEKETKDLIVFKDIHPKAPIHLLIVPKKHVADIWEETGAIWASIGKLAIELAKEMKLEGFRLVHNAGRAAIIPHMHVHFLGNVSAEREI
ncbi:MAG: HIT domain-containing protein [Patescibacteria group bacterium]